MIYLRSNLSFKVSLDIRQLQSVIQSVLQSVNHSDQGGLLLH